MDNVGGEGLESGAEVKNWGCRRGDDGVEGGEYDPAGEGGGRGVEEGAYLFALVCEVVAGGARSVIVGGGCG